MSTMSVGFVPRERFSSAPESLRSILEHTDSSHELLIVDCDTPPDIWSELEQLLQGRENVRILRAGRQLLPNEARNLVIREVQSEYLCLVENDNIVEEGWLEKFRAACEESPADVATPLLMEGRPGATSKVHFDDNLGSVNTDRASGGESLYIVPRTPTREMARQGRQFVECLETHCLFFRTSVFERIGDFDEALNTSEEVDLSLALQQASAPVVFEPACTIHYILPSFPLPEVDRRYFMMKWDLEQAHASHERITRKWRLSRFPQTMGFVEERYYRGTGLISEWVDELDRVRQSEGKAILAGIEEFEDPGIFDRLGVLPFTERDGQYYGAPADDEAAIQELERLRQEKDASLIAFLWSNYWQLDHYRGFGEHLRQTYAKVIDNDHLIAFDLSERGSAAMHGG